MATNAKPGIADGHEIQIKAGSVLLRGNLDVQANASGIVLFAHGVVDAI